MKKLNTTEMRNIEGGKTYSCACGKYTSTSYVKYLAHYVGNNIFNSAHYNCVIKKLKVYC